MSNSRTARSSTDDNSQLVAKISEATRELGIVSWDILIFGDGSGSGWDMGIGFACVLLDHFSWASKIFYGGINTGTITLGEMFPYIYAMDWFFSHDGPGRDRVAAARANQRLLQVHIVTDNAAVAMAGNNPDSRRSHIELWHAMDMFKQRGVDIVFHHWRRKGVSLNILADEVSRQSRITIQEAYSKAIQVLAGKYAGMPTNAQPEDFFLWD